MLNTDFNTINPFLPNQFEKTVPVLTNYIQQLLKLGAQKILIPNITLHETLDKITVFDKELFIHPFHLLKNELQQKTEKPVVILGTRYSMNNPYFNSFIEDEGIKISSLIDRDFLLVDEFRTAIYNNSESNELIENFENLLSELEKENTVIIACTELSAYLNSSKNQYGNIIDLAVLQIENAVSLA